MRQTLLLALLMLGGCDNFYEVQQADSIEAYEQYLVDYPDSRFKFQAVTRLEELYLDKAREEKTLDAYDVYLEKFPEGSYRDTAMKEREDFVYHWAEEESSAEAWQSYLDQYPKPDKKRKKRAEMGKKIAEYLPNLAVSEPRTKQVNLAEDPEGELNGWSIMVDVTNNGDKTLSYLTLTASYQPTPDVRAIRKEWPVVAERWGVPVEEFRKEPMKPGDTREWVWTTDELPQDWTGTATAVPTSIEYWESKDE